LKHGITEEEWEDYLAGQTTQHSRQRIDAHLVTCSSCWERYQYESPTMLALAAAAKEAKEKLVVSDERLRSMLAVVIADARSLEDVSTTRYEIRSGLHILRAILVPVFGPKAAQCAMVLAANGSVSRPFERMTRESWDAFVERLATIISIICGDIFAGLIREHGHLASASL
jgi:hypothetical protein